METAVKNSFNSFSAFGIQHQLTQRSERFSSHVVNFLKEIHI